jgi:hypothetical protein
MEKSRERESALGNASNELCENCSKRCYFHLHGGDIPCLIHRRQKIIYLLVRYTTKAMRKLNVCLVISDLKLTGTPRAPDTHGIMHLLPVAKGENYISPGQDAHPILANQNQRMTC